MMPAWNAWPAGLAADLRTAGLRPGAAAGAAGAAGEGAAQLPGARPGAVAAEQAARAFEAVFLELLLGQMRTAAESLGGRQRGAAHAIYGGWFDAAVAQHLAAAGGLGLADVLARHLQTGTGATPVESGTKVKAEEARHAARRDYANSSPPAADVAGG